MNEILIFTVLIALASYREKPKEVKVKVEKSNDKFVSRSLSAKGGSAYGGRSSGLRD